PRIEANLAEAARLIAMAAEGGAGLVVLPENVAIMGLRETDKLAHRETDAGGPLQAFFAEQAQRHRVWLVAGTIPMMADNPDRARQSSLLYDDTGRRVARYDKIHLFDVDVEGDRAYRESATLEPGNGLVLVDTPFGRLGMTICYDLRFPELFRLLVEQGAELIVLPSAFTARTGEAHWRTLVRARAIENLCYIVAPNQGGYHVNGRETHGESMIVDPWGKVVDCLNRGSGVVFGDLDLSLVADVRERFPTLLHRRFRILDEPLAASSVESRETAEQ
ncbi:MAG: carbon-nitrogen hydrolase family protein, partial [Aquisalimonadaceae bacterium]